MGWRMSISAKWFLLIVCLNGCAQPFERSPQYPKAPREDVEAVLARLRDSAFLSSEWCEDFRRLNDYSPQDRSIRAYVKHVYESFGARGKSFAYEYCSATGSDVL